MKWPHNITKRFELTYLVVSSLGIDNIRKIVENKESGMDYQEAVKRTFLDWEIAKIPVKRRRFKNSVDKYLRNRARRNIKNLNKIQ